MKTGATVLLCFVFLAVCPARAQSVAVCTIEKTAVAKADGTKLTMEIQEGGSEKLRTVFAQLDSPEPVLKVKNVEKRLTVLRREKDLIWLRDSTSSTIGEGVLVWMIDLKARVVIRSESLRTTKLEGQVGSDPMAILQVGRCE
jgi:hypothetical protein